MQRKRFVWKLRESELVFAEQTLVAGLVPVMPFAAQDGVLYDNVERAYARALLLEEQGAAFIVLWAEVLKAGKPLVSAEEQHRRVAPILKKLRGEIGIPVAVATTRSETAQRALELGAEIIIDPSAAGFEPAIAKVVAEANAVLMLGHLRGTPERWAKQAPVPDPIATVLGDLDAGIHRARMANLQNTQLAVEPGLGMGKRRDENAAVAARVFLLNRFELPVCVNVSAPGILTEDTPGASLAMATQAVVSAAHMLIAFDVEATLQAVAVADAIGKVKAYEATVLPKDKPRETPGFGKRPGGRESRPPRDEEPREDRPRDDRPREERPYGEGRGPREDRPQRDDRPPRRDYEPGGDRPPQRDDRPPRGDYAPRGDRPPSGDRPPRGDYRPSGDRPPPSGDRPPRGDYRPSGDRPPPRGDRPPPRGDYAPRGDRPPSRGNYGPRGDGPPSRGDYKPRGDRPPAGGDRPPSRGGYGPRGDGPPSRGD
ncbi:MAG: dihydropteroate synthase, partial [Acidobacteriota bacterium]